MGRNKKRKRPKKARKPKKKKIKRVEDVGPPCGTAAVEPRVGSRHPNECDAFECLTCAHEWRMRPITTEYGWGWPVHACPMCKGLYWEWLSYDIDVEDVWLNRDGPPPDGTATVRRIT